MSPKESLQTFSAIRFFLYLQVITMLIILISHKLYVEGIAVKESGLCSLPLEYYPWFKEAAHGAELPFLFPMRFNITSSADDMSFPMTMMKYWSNFANTGYVLSCTNEMKRWILLLSLTHYERPLPTIDNVTNRR